MHTATAARQDDLPRGGARRARTWKALLAKPRQLLINGQWVNAASRKTFPTYNAETGEVIAHVAEGNRTDVDRAVAAARVAFKCGAWPKLADSERGALIWQLAGLVEEFAEAFAELEWLEHGESVAVARVAAVPTAIENLRRTADWAAARTISLSTSGPKLLRTAVPVGVVGQIVSWNFPLIIAVSKVAWALVSGCTLVLKPAEQSPLTALMLGELIQGVRFPKGVVNIVTGYGETAAAALAVHAGVDRLIVPDPAELWVPHDEC